MLSISPSFEVINVAVSDSKVLFWIAASVTYAIAVNPNGVKTLSSDGLSTFFFKGKPFFGSGPKRLTKNHPDCPILCNCVFDNVILANELFAKSFMKRGILCIG